MTLRQLIAPCCVIDVSRKCVDTEAGRSYLVSVDDIADYESAHGELSEGCIVLIRTGWSKYWKHGPGAYLGYDEEREGPFDPSRAMLQFPGIGTDAAHMFVARRVAAVGLDTASVDHGPSLEFMTHRIFAAAGIYGIENVSSAIVGLPPRGSTVFVLPLKISGGSGSPSRIVAIVPEDNGGEEAKPGVV
jgi:kynurenine formamidase